MSAVTVLDLSEEMHRALQARASQNGRSAEAEMLDILEKALRSDTGLKIGSELAAFGKSFGGIELTISRDRTPLKPAEYE
ncbi:Arc family DNA-binding protein [Rugamonas sp. FT107W]|uniref:Arc family DNA-binding protein n=1 Tax=Duganella vulcania TaxID=2692166 RepID=A0A845HCE8_9BURK|nr:Arc family DNA-binding protein [Duganella vulcania]MYN16308.1 Arc family DNA-binding protein [Duganella vulcania]